METRNSAEQADENLLLACQCYGHVLKVDSNNAEALNNWVRAHAPPTTTTVSQSWGRIPATVPGGHVRNHLPDAFYLASMIGCLPPHSSPGHCPSPTRPELSGAFSPSTEPSVVNPPKRRAPPPYTRPLPQAWLWLVADHGQAGPQGSALASFAEGRSDPSEAIPLFTEACTKLEQVPSQPPQHTHSPTLCLGVGRRRVQTVPYTLNPKPRTLHPNLGRPGAHPAP